MDALERQGLATYVSHATDLLRPTRRYCPTAAGLRTLAEAEGMALDELLRSRPVSAQWRRILMERLDAVGLIYRLASSIAAESGPVGLRWYRAAPLDAVIELPDGRTLGIVRQGLTSDRTGFSKRLWRLRRGLLPGVVFMILPDEVRVRHARKLLDGSPIQALLALEQHVAWASATEPVWRLPSVAPARDLRYVLSSYLESGGWLITEPEPSRATLPEDIGTAGRGRRTPDWLLPAVLKPAAKVLLHLLYDWPGIAPEDLRGLLCVSRGRLYEVIATLSEAGLVSRTAVGGHRLALSDRGLALLARRDRTSVGAARKRWSVKPIDPDSPEDWRNISGGRSRQLLRNGEHTTAVHEFIAALARQSRSLGWELAQIDPPMRAARHFRHQYRLRSVNPDAFGILRRGSTSWPFFLEWERRAVRPSTMAERLAPYLRYYSSPRPIDDHGAQPAILIVFHDELAATHFLQVARERMELARVEAPLLVSHRGLLHREGPLGLAWRAPGAWETVHALPNSQ
ncbi:MAG: replication-relaxation family protein [Chloroflexota bacterium]|nr:replication-relaxation family protein [Chloroflexota bacterium]